MDAALLIDAVVRQTTVLIATLATTSGQRAQLAHVANRVFADLVRQLRSQRLSNKVIADMFGMALRTYNRKTTRMSSSRTEQGRSLWEAVLRHIEEHGPVLRSELLQRFHRDDESIVRSVAADLVESGLVQRTGRDDATRFAALELKPAADDRETRAASLESTLLVALHRSGPLQLEGLAALVPTALPDIEAALAQLTDDGLISVHTRAKQTFYSCETCIIPFGNEVGWEAAVLDHYQAVVAALVTKLRSGSRRAELADRVGGSTFVFDLWQGHPLQEPVLDYLKTMREHGLGLRRALDQHAASTPKPQDAAPLRVIAYVGQTITEVESEDDA